jgi:A/G-specific adenine glycosylase
VLKPHHQKDILDDIKSFRKVLAAWFSKNARDHPWRRTRNPYEILISEVMLQQTQIATVLGKGYYTRFLSIFPDVGALAAADDDALLKAWEGLGYYRRVRMLRETARAVIARHNGKFPHDLDDLLKLPGIGKYTAGALLAFAFRLPAVLVDGNVARVLSRLMDCTIPVDEPAGSKLLWARAGQLACDKRPEVHHAALMELGQTVCRPGVPDCQSCPVAGFCRTSHPERLPIKSRKTAITAIQEHALWLRDRRGRILLHREDGKRRTGLWKLPVRDPAEVDGLPELCRIVYPITRYRVTLLVHAGTLDIKLPLREGEAWVDADAWQKLAMAAPFRRIVGRLSSDS